MSEEQEKSFDLRHFLAALSRRRKTLTIVAACCALATLALAFLLPPYYLSSGTILIEQQEVPTDLVRSTVTAYADQRVQSISQRVMTTQNLLDIIRRYKLYPRQRQRDTREELIERMRKDIDLKMISADVIDPRSGQPQKATIAFSVSYTSPSAEQAVKVANELTTLYLNENLTERTRLANDASSFLAEESARLSQEMGGLESKLADFKAKHVEDLPELQGMNLQLLDRTEQELRDLSTRRMSLEQQRVFLEAQLAQIKPNSMLTTDGGERILSPQDRLKMLKSQLASAQALYAPDHPDIGRLEREIVGLEKQTGAQTDTNELHRQLEKAQGELASARERYSPDHPDVERLERRVAGLQTELAKVGAADAGGAPASGSEAGARPPADMPDNPAFIQLQAQLSATRNDLAALDAQTGQVRTKLAGYQRNVSLSPMVEKEYRQLSRDLDSAHLKYQEVRSKQMEAQLAQNLEADRKGERFTLIEPPLPPEKPVSPNRPLILVLGLLLTMGASIGVAMLRETVDGTVRGKEDMRKAFNVPPLALVPYIETRADRLLARRRRKLTLVGAAAAGVLAVVAMHLFYRPLDVLWFIAMRRFGL